MKVKSIVALLDAMMIAGLGAMGFIARRRKSR
jgi:hypothetical protein